MGFKDIKTKLLLIMIFLASIIFCAYLNLHLILWPDNRSSSVWGPALLADSTCTSFLIWWTSMQIDKINKYIFLI